MNPWESFEKFKEEYEKAEEWLDYLVEVGLKAGHLEPESDCCSLDYELTDPERRLEIQAEEAEAELLAAKREAERRDQFSQIWKDARNQHGID